MPGTFEFVFTPDGSVACAVNDTMWIEITPSVVPQFAQIGPLCQDEEPSTLSATDENGITGTWLPDTIETGVPGTFEFVFTPDGSVACAVNDTMWIEITPSVVPQFAQIGPLCQDEEPPTLPATDENGITGTWLPDTIETGVPGTFEFVFTPDGSVACAVNETIWIEITPSVIPQFAQIGPLCQDEEPPTLPATDENGITGTWLPDTILTDAAGTFEFIFTPDAGGACAVDTTIIIVINELPSLVINDPDPVCEPGVVNLTDPVIFEGSTPNLTFTYWLDEETTQPLDKPDSVAVSDIYYIRAENDGGCTAVAAVNVTIDETPLLVITHPDAVCQPDTIDLTDESITSGSGDGLYLTYWLDEEMTTELDNPDELTESGIYYICAESAAGCKAIMPVEVTIHLRPGTPMLATVDPDCETPAGSIEITAPLGGSYSYSIDGENFRAEPLFEDLEPGTYTVTVMNEEGCTNTSETTILSAPDVPDVPELAVIQPDCITPSGTIEVTAPLGDSYTYSIDGINFRAEPLFENLEAGDYTVTVMNEEGCTNTAEAIINELIELVVEHAVTHVLCYEDENGAILLDIISGTEPYLIEWSNGSTETGISGLAAGSYAVSITDANKCEVNLSFEILQPDPIVIAAEPVHVSAYGLADGAIEVTVTGGTGAYTWSWTGPDGFTASTHDIDGLSAGVYELTVVDANDCQATVEVEIDEPASIVCPPPAIERVACFSDVPPAFEDYNAFIVEGGEIFGSCEVDEASFMFTEEWLAGTCPRVLTRTYFIDVICGGERETISCENTIVIDDETPPEMVCPDTLFVTGTDPVPARFGTFADFHYAGGDAWDNCGIVEESFRESGESSDQISPLEEIIVRTYEIADSCGLTDECSHVIVVTREADLTMDCPEDLQVQCWSEVDPPFATYAEFFSAGGSATSLCGFNHASSLRYIGQTTEGKCPEILTRSYEITDLCGNKDTCQHIIEIWDTTPPTISCLPLPAITVRDYPDNNIPAPYTSLSDFIAAGGQADDNCGIEHFYSSDGEMTGENPSIIERTYFVEDSCGNSNFCIQRITVYFKEMTVSCPPPIEVQCITDVPEPYDTYEAFELAGGSASNFVEFYRENDVSDNESCPETITRTYVFVDEDQDTLRCQQQIIVDDTEAPTFARDGEEMTINCDETETIATYSNINAFIAATGADDNCGIDYSYFPPPRFRRLGRCPEVREYTYEIRDLCENYAYYTQRVILEDIPPRLQVPPLARRGCTLPPPFTRANFTGLTHDCNASVTMTVGNPVVVVAGCPGEIQRTYTFTTECGESIQWTERFFVEDTVPPAFVQLPAPVTIECDEPLPAPYSYSVFSAAGGKAEDDCGLDEGSFRHLPGEDIVLQEMCPRVILRTYEIYDWCGNWSTFTDTLTITDTTPPVARLPETELGPFDFLEDMPAPYGLDDLLDVSDNCGEVFLADTLETGEAGCSGTIIRAYVISDECGNTDTLQQRITISNQVPPVVVYVPPLFAPCEPPEHYTRFEDFEADGGVVTAAFGEIVSIEMIDEDRSETNCPEIITRYYTVTDECGNEVSFTQILTVNDTIPPEFVLPPDIIGDEHTVVPPPYASWEEVDGVDGGIASDNCRIETFEMLPETDEIVGEQLVITRIYRVTDPCGNTAIDTMRITLPISEPVMVCPPASAYPVFDCVSKLPDQLTLDEFLELGGSVFSYCGINSASFQMIDERPFGNNCDGARIRTYEITDLCGRTVYCEHTIRFRDNIDPILTCPPDVVVEVGEAVPGVPLPWVVWIARGGDAEDNCDLRTNSLQWRQPDVLKPGIAADTLLRTFRVGDACGNFDECTQTIIIKNDIDFDFDCPPLPMVEVECLDDLPVPYASYKSFEEAGGYAYSECVVDTATFTHLYDLPGGDENCITSVTRYYQISDECGTSITCTQVFVINDQTAPVLSEIPQDTTVACIGDVPTVPEVTATDNCGGKVTITFSESVTDSVCVNGLILIRTWTATDGCENSASEVQRIRVDDQVPPEISCPDTLTFSAGIDELESLTGLPYSETEQPVSPDDYGTIGISVSDNCAVDSVTYRDELSGICPQVVSRTFTVYDVCGNSDDCIQTIELFSTFSPEFDPIGPVCQFAEPPALPETDLNGVPGTWSPAVVSTGEAGIFEFVFTPDEAYGCIEEFTLTIEILQSIIPVFNSIDPISQFNSPPVLPINDLMGVSGQWNPDVILTDSIGLFEYVFSPFPEYECAETFIMVIEITSPEPPEISCPPAMEVECFNNPFSSLSEFFNAGGTYSSYWEADSLVLISETVSEEICPGLITRDYQIMNTNGDFSNTCTHQITVNDQTNPRILCPPDITVDKNQNIPPRLTMDEFFAAGGVIADNCKIDTSSFGLMSEFLDTLLT